MAFTYHNQLVLVLTREPCLHPCTDFSVHSTPWTSPPKRTPDFICADTPTATGQHVINVISSFFILNILEPYIHKTRNHHKYLIQVC